MKTVVPIFFGVDDMTLSEASKLYSIEIDKLLLYEDRKLISGKITEMGERDYDEEEIKKTALIGLLLETGCTYEEVRMYLTDKTAERRIGLLKRRRFQVLDQLHDKQKLLQNLDYLIYENEKGSKKE